MTHDFHERKEQCQKKTFLDYLKIVTVLLTILYFAIALLGGVTEWADRVEKSLGVEDRAQSMRDTKLSKEMRNEY